MKWISLILILCFITSCTTTHSTYIPVSHPIYKKKINLPVIIKLIDKRNTKLFTVYPGAFTIYEKDFDAVNFDRPVMDIVKEALVTEFQHFGLQVLDEESTIPKDTLLVQCEILNFETIATKKSLASNMLEFSVAIKFRWIDYINGNVLEENERSEKRIRKTGLGKEYGKQLVNDLLPKVIEKELRLNKLLYKNRQR